MLIRDYTADDRAEVAAVLAQLTDVGGGQVDSLVSYRRHVAVADGQVVGTAAVLIERKLGGRVVAHIEDVVVASGYRRQGIGRALVMRCLSTATLSGAYKAVLSCSKHNEGFYRGCGFSRYDSAMRIDL